MPKRHLLSTHGRQQIDAWLLEATHLLHLQRPSGSVRLCRKVLRKDRDHLPALEILAKALWRLGMYEQAMCPLRQLIRLNPQEPGYRYLLGSCLQALGRYGDAVAAFERCAGGDERLQECVNQSLRDLAEWQEDLVALLVREDRAFRALYMRDPELAFKRRGFAFSKKDLPAAPLSKIHTQRVWDRPS